MPLTNSLPPLQSQGVTVFPPNSIYTDLNECFGAAMAYVILSRIVSATQLFLKPFDQKKIYCSAVAKAEAKRLRERAVNHQKTEWDLEQRGIVRICTINANSLQQHYQDLIKDEFIMKSDIICVQETWLERDLEDTSNVFQHFYIHGRSKGIALLSRTKPLDIVTFQSENCTLIKASYTGYIVINIYRFAGSNQIQGFTDEVLSYLDPEKTTIILTDCNINYLKLPDNPFSASLKHRGFKQIVCNPTHMLGSLLDHIYYTSPSPEASCKLYKMHSVFWSDHTCVAAILKTNSEETSTQQEEHGKGVKRPFFVDEIVAGVEEVRLIHPEEDF